MPPLPSLSRLVASPALFVLSSILIVGTFGTIANYSDGEREAERSWPIVCSSQKHPYHHRHLRHYKPRRLGQWQEHQESGDLERMIMVTRAVEEEEQETDDDPLASSGINEPDSPSILQRFKRSKHRKSWLGRGNNKVGMLLWASSSEERDNFLPGNLTGSEGNLKDVGSSSDQDKRLVINESISDLENGGVTSTNNSEELMTRIGDPQPIITFTTVFLVLMFSMLLILTIIGNALVCLSLLFVKKLRKPQNYLIASLAVSDLFVALFVMPFAIVLEVYEGQWPFNKEFCDFWVSGKHIRQLYLCLYAFKHFQDGEATLSIKYSLRYMAIETANKKWIKRLLRMDMGWCASRAWRSLLTIPLLGTHQNIP